MRQLRIWLLRDSVSDTVRPFRVNVLCIEVCFATVALIASAVPAYLFTSKFFSVDLSVWFLVVSFSSSTFLC